MIQAAQQTFPGLPVERMCQRLAVNRGRYYRHREAPRPTHAAVALRAALEAVVLEFPAYGYRRVTHTLQRDGWCVNQNLVGDESTSHQSLPKSDRDRERAV